MADQEEDFSSLPLPDRFAHKNWKVRKEAYEAAAKEFDNAQHDGDPVVRQFATDSSLWKAAVTDSNVAAHQEALAALCSFLQICGTFGCTRTRGVTIASLAEKGLTSTKPAAKQKALEAILLYVELDKAEPVIEELLPSLSHKTPKVIAATLSAFTSIYHEYGCKTADPKPVLKALPKVFGHADKNVRAEAQNLTVELYRWLRDGMKPMFWDELKPVQQQDLEKLFEKVKEEPPPKQQRLLKSQQEKIAAAPPQQATGGDDIDDDVEEEGDFEPEIMAVDVFPKIPKDFDQRMSSSKWKDRKDALDELEKAVDAPAIEEGPFDDILRALAKCVHKDANVACVMVAAHCIELIARGLRKSFAKYRATVMVPVMERLKERKPTVTDAVGAALDAVFASTSLSECLEGILEFLQNKNPQIKLGTTQFLCRSLKTTRDAPAVSEAELITNANKKLLGDSQETQRNASAEVIGVLLKIMGERIMNKYLDDIEEIRKAKVKEYCDAAEVKAKYKPKAAPPPKPAAAPPGQKKPVAKKAPGAATAASRKPASPEPAATPLQPKPTARPGIAKPGAAGARPGLKPPSGAKKLAQPSSATPKSPSRAAQPSPDFDEAPPAPKPTARGLAGRTLTKPSAPAADPAPQPASSTSQPLPSIERIELDELRSEVGRLRTQNEHLRGEQSKLNSQINELQNQNAQLIEDHTRDVLSIKAKETQLVRARSDAENAEQQVSSMQREVDRLKRELQRIGRATSPRQEYGSMDVLSESNGDVANGGYASPRATSVDMKRRTMMSPTASSFRGEGKENLPVDPDAEPPQGLQGRLQSSRPMLNTRPVGASNTSRPDSASPARGSPRPVSYAGSRSGLAAPSSFSRREAAPTPTNGNGVSNDGDARLSGNSNPSAYSARSAATSRSTSGEAAEGGGAAATSGVESWKRAAEVTQNLKARIELMKARQGMRQA